MTTYKDREDRLITEMETRTEYNNELREMGDSARADRYDNTVKYVCLYYLVKEPEDLTKIWQIKRMIKKN
jgi:hypothetical protein